MVKMLEIAVLFISVSFLLFLGISMFSQIPEPTAGTDEAEQFEGLSKIIDISYNGFYAILFILLLAVLVLSVVVIKKIL